MIEIHRDNAHRIAINQKIPEKFSQKEVTFDDIPLFFPRGFEKFFLILYTIALPYITGTLFLFFYVSNGQSDLYFSLNDHASFIFSWIIGYEILAAIALIFIVKSAISYTLSIGKNPSRFKRP